MRAKGRRRRTVKARDRGTTWDCSRGGEQRPRERSTAPRHLFASVLLCTLTVELELTQNERFRRRVTKKLNPRLANRIGLF